MRTVRNIVEAGPAAQPPGSAACEDVRCGCGSLLARVVGGEVELKCRRCKHVWRIALAAGGAAELDRTEPRRRRMEETS